ncbi:type I-B CRISPR-associated protein Cas7/Cst2/DevR [Ruminococcus sp. Marseille-P6503]|uniref:type I-B CRISPR-associated protein Cas7/Cst2/DevR n=1 Tax=Ruminococcus sp. Marseille-P6503 TaxID=2364796 RepID=UPI0019D27229|nr:type I-B CRISPR-associated protein Cas7/Cst2/DevR [Ruminococcus sp. Marseille-P6503]
MNKGLTLSVIVEANSANYGEAMGNIASLKKISRAGGDGYTYISRQALRYNIVSQLGWDKTPIEPSGSGDKTVIQFAPDTSIADYPEIDLFGYMKTLKGNNALTRNAAARLSNAVSLEPFSSDLDFLTNMGLAQRKEGVNNSIAQSEIHKSFYAYTLTVDLNRVGVDDKMDVEISQEEKAERVCQLLKAVQYLYRDIRGRSENLSPVFAIGGLYSRKTPFFENRLKLRGQSLNLDTIIDTKNGIGEDGTIAGYVSGVFKNDAAIKENLETISISEMFDRLSRQVKEYYNESNKA